MKTTFKQFAFHVNVSDIESAQRTADVIDSGDFVPSNERCDRYWKSGGYTYDIGRKPFLVKFTDGSIAQKWAMNKTEVRDVIGSHYIVKIIPDPFA